MITFAKWGLFFFGITFLGLGNAMAVNVKFLGLNSWDVLNVALTEKIGLTIGSWNVLIGMLLVLICIGVDRKYVNAGTFLNALLVGPIMDFFLWIGILPKATNSWLDYVILICAIILAGIGGGMYVAASVGAGPRDGFMLILSEKLGTSVSRARIIAESSIVLIGFLLGGPVFIFTFIYTFIQSPIYQHSFTFHRHLMEMLIKKKNPQFHSL